MAELWIQRVDLTARLGNAWKPANEYIDGFRTTIDGRLGLKKRVRLLSEVAKLWESGTWELEGKRYRSSKDQILQAMHQVANAQKCGFQNHNYLKRCLQQTAAKLSEEGLTAAEEEAREKRRREARGKGREDKESLAGASSYIASGLGPAERSDDGITLEEFKKRTGKDTTNLMKFMGT
jgi:hypothetical protein